MTMNKDQALEYKEEIANLYSRRSQAYDSSEWHDQIARKLIGYSNIAVGSQVLDIATGTGMVAFYAASKVGSQGAVIGIDISEGMIEKANAKLITTGIPNIRFELGDGEGLAFAPNSFDYIFCGSAFIWMADLHAALVHWRTRLKEKGKVGFHAFSENAFVTGVIAQSVLSKYGVSYLMNKPTGSVEKCQELLEQAGFRNVAVKVDADGRYISLEEAKNSWVSALHPAPGQFPHPLAGMTTKQLADAWADYERELVKLNTQKGIWNDMTTFYVFGEK
jgi:ubiquinone/menaquinone biosynthesis C-methylase UbiE